MNAKHTLRGHRAIAALSCVSALCLFSAPVAAQDMAAVVATAEARLAELTVGTATGRLCTTK